MTGYACGHGSQGGTVPKTVGARPAGTPDAPRKWPVRFVSRPFWYIEGSLHGAIMVESVDSAESDTSARDTLPPAGKARILLVDDSQFSLSQLTRALGDEF